MMPSALALLIAVLPAFGASGSPWGEKAYGVLLVGPDGGGDWKTFVDQVKKRLGPDVPVEAFAGPLEPKSLQKALDRFQASRARKVAVVPVLLHEESMELSQLRYILGLEKLPSRPFLEFWGMTRRVVPRVKSKAALVLAAPLGADEAAAAALASHAKGGARRGPPEAVLVIGVGAETDDENAVRLKELDALLGMLAKDHGLAGARGWLLRPPSKDRPRQGSDSAKGLKDVAQGMTRGGRVVIVPWLMTQDGSARSWKRILENPFLRWVDKGLLPDDGLARWAAAKAEGLRGTADQVRFKDAGQALPEAERKR
ncbi:MAG: hypothetical protein FD126_1563 [Elusimicrobia bacterium]|nr:MAG: hypothetical protein FD126_1563 [Elusimicrobiota bacterium]